jgi:acetolactate synthase I/II/III large subunit
LLVGYVEGFRRRKLKMHMTGAELLIRLLEHQGVRIVAGIPGGALLPLYDALGRSRIRHILARHEQGAGFIAQGIARRTGKAAVCFATSGPGVTNLVTAIADAKLDSVPLVCIAGQVPTALIGTDAFQEVATLDIVRSITKKAYFIRSAADLAQVIPEAVRIAEEGRPGPVLIDVPKDIQTQHVRVTDDVFSAQAHSSPAESVGPLHRDYEVAAHMLAKSKRPVLYVGGGVVKARATHLLRRFVEQAQLPTTMTLMALGTLATDHPLSIGMLGMHGARYTNRVIEECDLLLTIGARFDDRATGDAASFAPNAKIIHIDIDARELGKIKQPCLAIQDDARNALAELCERVSVEYRSSWLDRVSQLKAAYPLVMPRADELCTPYGIVRAVGELAPPECIVTTDVGQHQMWVAQAFPFTKPECWLTSGGLGTMGFGLPAAIGASLAQPEITTICFSGDGSLLMNIQELATLAELNLNVKIVLLDNAALGLVRQQQELFYGRKHVASMFIEPTRFTSVADAFGIASFDLGASATRKTLRKALMSAGPALIRVPIDAREFALPMVPPGKANIDALDCVMLG